MSNSTLTGKLFLRIAPTVAVTILIVAALAFSSATREINNIYDAQLIDDTNVLWALLEHKLVNPSEFAKRIPDIDFNMDDQLALNEDADDYADAHMFRGWNNGRIVVYSSTAFPADVPQQKAGFSTVTYDNEAWRVYSLPIPNTTIVMEVGEKLILRKALVANILLNLFFPLVVLVPIIGFLTWLGINSGLSSIRDLVRQIRTRSPDDLSTIRVAGLPRDLRPLGRSINQLLGKLGRSLTLERRFSDLAAHQLRTPQAGVKLLLQMLAQADSEAERQAIVADLVACSDRSTHLIEQLLRLGRVSHHPLELAPVRVYNLVASLLENFDKIAASRHIHISLDGDKQAVVRADESLLSLMIDNVIDNAIKYTPVGGRVAVTIAQETGGLSISVSDNGPGIPIDQREAVFQRFYRLDGLQHDGAGLGLAIVSDVAARLSVTVNLSTPSWGEGLRAELVIPMAESA
jgi:two-component system OmpR family sensor kinase/two-component system sensor histidine kinase QseC